MQLQGFEQMLIIRLEYLMVKLLLSGTVAFSRRRLLIMKGRA